MAEEDEGEGEGQGGRREGHPEDRAAGRQREREKDRDRASDPEICLRLPLRYLFEMELLAAVVPKWLTEELIDADNKAAAAPAPAPAPKPRTDRCVALLQSFVW